MAIYDNKMLILSNWSGGGTTVQLHHTVVLLQMLDKEARWQLHKDAMGCFKQILEPYKKAPVWPLTFHLTNYQRKMKSDMKDKFISNVLL